jgi:transketolase
VPYTGRAPGYLLPAVPDVKFPRARKLFSRFVGADLSEGLTGQAIRRIVLEQSRRAHVGHIGSALSVADMVATLYGDVMRVASPSDPERDRFILSKGHAALALYGALNLKGVLSDEGLRSFCGDGSVVGVHPEHSLPGIDFSTGSLGHGLSLATGAALAAKMERSGRRVYTLLSDAECNEGSVWEAAMFAAHHKLGNLTALIDKNGQQALGYTKDVLDLDPLSEKWSAFGWDCVAVDGHDRSAMKDAILSAAGERPRAVVCNTIFGKGVGYMERQIKWHYLPMSDADYDAAVAEVG